MINVVQPYWHTLRFFGGRRRCDKEANKGLLLEREDVDTVCGVPVEQVRYLPRGMMVNVDDMTCMYSTEQGCVVINKEKGLVLKMKKSQ